MSGTRKEKQNNNYLSQLPINDSFIELLHFVTSNVIDAASTEVGKEVTTPAIPVIASQSAHATRFFTRLGTVNHSECPCTSIFRTFGHCQPLRVPVHFDFSRVWALSAAQSAHAPRFFLRSGTVNRSECPCTLIFRAFGHCELLIVTALPFFPLSRAQLITYCDRSLSYQRIELPPLY